MSEEETTPPVVEQEKPNLSLLAQERFGNKFHGEVTEPEEVIPEDIPEETPPEEGETPDDLPEAAELGEDAPQEDDEPAISSVSEFDAALREEGYDVDVLALQHTGKVNGKEVTRTVSEWIAEAQKVEAADDILDSAKEKNRAQQEENAQRSEEIVKQFTVASTLVGSLEQALMASVETVDWAKLEAEDPGEFAAKKVKFQEEQQRIQAIKQHAATEYNNWTQQQQAENEVAQREYLAAEQEALLVRIPEWQEDAEVANTQKAGIAEYLSGAGFSNEEISEAADSRLIAVARKAWLYDQQSQSNDAAKKKVAKIPKTLKPGPKKTEAQVNSQEIMRLTKLLRDTGDIKYAHQLRRAKKAAQ